MRPNTGIRVYSSTDTPQELAAKRHVRAAYNPGQKRDDSGQWTSGGGGGGKSTSGGGKTSSTKPVGDVDYAGIAVHGKPSGKGTPDDPIQVHGDVDLAVKLLGEGKHVRLQQPDEVATMLGRLDAVVKDAVSKGEKAPTYNLCKVSMPGSNLFCAESKGIPRAKMPQLSGQAREGTPAWAARDAKGTVDGAPVFQQSLIDHGIKVEAKDMPASHLRATQAELDGPKVASMYVAMKNGKIPESPIFVTTDGYIVDGHHRWAAKVALDAADGKLGDITMPVKEVHLDIGATLDFANKFTTDFGIKTKGLGAAAEGLRAAIRASVLAIRAAGVPESLAEHPPHERPVIGGYPIAHDKKRAVDDLRNAIQAYGRSKESERAATRRHIITQARRIGRPDLIPDGWLTKTPGVAASGTTSSRGARVYSSTDSPQLLALKWAQDIALRDHQPRDAIGRWATTGGVSSAPVRTPRTPTGAVKRQIPGQDTPPTITRDKNGDIVVSLEAKRLGTEVYKKAVKLEPGISKNVTRTVGDPDPDTYAEPTPGHGELFGFAFRLKTESGDQLKVERIVEEKGLTRRAAAADVKDSVRYTAHYHESTIAKEAQGTIDGLRAAGNEVKVKNTWNDPDNPYKGVNVQVKTAAGLRYELQMHTPASQRTKDEMHVLYEQARTAPPGSAKQKALKAKMDEMQWAVPPGIHGVH